jgi:hypothetical protein
MLTGIPAGAQVSAGQQADPLERYCPSGPTLISCRRQGEAALFQQHPGLAHRRSNELILMLTNGDSSIVRDTIAVNIGDYESNYWLAGINERAGYFVLAMYGYENRGALVVSRRTGWRKFIDFNLPVFDSAGSYAAAIIPVGTAYWEPAIDVFRVGADSLTSEFHFPSPGTADPFVRGDTLWGPTNPHWEAGQLLVETEETVNRYDYWSGKPQVLAKLNGRWVLRPRK